jgi:sodium transport system permease protein
MKTFWTVFKKEWLAVFRDRRSLIINAVVFGIGFPVIVFLPYMLLFGSMVGQLSKSLDVAVSGLEHAPELVDFMQLENKHRIQLVPVTDVEAAVRSQGFSVGLVIPPGFESDLAGYQPTAIEMITRQGQILNTQPERVSSLLRSFREDLLARRIHEKNLSKEFINPFTVKSREVLTESRFQRSMAGWMMVLMLTLYGFAVGMSKAVSITAGEKEQLTMEVLLLSPASRAGIVLGKAIFILTYGVASLLLGLISTILMFVLGLVILARNLDLTKFFNNLSQINSASASPAPAIVQVTFASLLMILLLMLFCLMIFTILQMLVGLWARNEGQANNILAAVTLLPGLISLVFFSDTYTPPLWHYAIPLLGQILLIPDLLVNRWEMAPLLIGLVSSAVTVGLFVLITVWLLRHETIIART